MVVACVRSLWYGSNVYNTGGVPIRILEVCWDVEFGNGRGSAEWVSLLGLERDGFSAGVHHMNDKVVDALD